MLMCFYFRVNINVLCFVPRDFFVWDARIDFKTKIVPRTKTIVKYYVT